MKTLLKALFLLACLAGAAFIFGKWYVHQWSQTQITLPGDVVYDFLPGTSLSRLAQDLESQGLITSSEKFRLHVKAEADFRKFQAGKYRFTAAVSPAGIISDLTAGKIFQPVVVEYVIPEGFSFKMIRNRFVARGLGTEREIEKLWTDKKFLTELKVPSTSFEGFIYPATYKFIKMIDARDAIVAGVEMFWRQLPQDYEKQIAAVGLNLKDAVTFASLIEIETRLDDERSMVSEVIWRRLRNGEPIGIDAALIYGIKDYRGDIKTIHLKDAKNKYNTRIHKGLPPTPIGSPSAASLKAVLNPSNEGYYYYVRDIDTADRHYFSRTRAEHERYVAKLVAKTRKRSTGPIEAVQPQTNE